MLPSRESFLRVVRALELVPYVWGGRTVHGIDCSGVVTLAYWLAGGPDWRDTVNTDALMLPKGVRAGGREDGVEGLGLEVVPEASVRPGDLCLYGPSDDDADHVMVFMGNGRVMGACGGDRTTKTVALAYLLNPPACVRVKPLVRYRPHFRGFRRLPFAD